MEKLKCPKCKSEEIEAIKIGNSKGIVCNKCGYDESTDTPEERKSQREKTKHSPYKRGGHNRK